jgi:hypothetical protein
VPLSSNPLLHISGVLSICSFPKNEPYGKATDQDGDLERDAVHHSLPGIPPASSKWRTICGYFFVAMKMFVSLVLNKYRKLAVDARGIEVLEAAIDENLFATTEHCLMRDESLRILSIIAPTLRVLSSSAMRYNFILVHRPVMPPLPCLVELSLSYHSWLRANPLAITVVSSLPVMPSLRRLDLSGLDGITNHLPGPDKLQPIKLFQRVQRLAPSLTHILLWVLSMLNLLDASRELKKCLLVSTRFQSDS